MSKRDDREKVLAAGAVLLGESFWEAARSHEGGAEDWRRRLACACSHPEEACGSRIFLPDALPKEDFLVWRPATGGTVEIFDIAVANERRGQGRGRVLVELLFALVPQANRVWAITRADNLAAVQFYSKLRFGLMAPIWELHGDDRRVDALMFGRSPRGPV